MNYVEKAANKKSRTNPKSKIRSSPPPSSAAPPSSSPWTANACSSKSPTAEPANFTIKITHPVADKSKFADLASSAKTLDRQTRQVRRRTALAAIELKGTPAKTDDARLRHRLPSCVPVENPYNAYMRMTGVDFFKDGRAAVWPGGDVWIVSGIDKTLEKSNGSASPRDSSRRPA